MSFNIRGQKTQQEADKQTVDQSKIALFAAKMEQMITTINSFTTNQSAMNAEIQNLKETRFRPSSSTPQVPQMILQQSNQPLQATQSTTQPTTYEDKRWRPEKVGYFDGTGDIYAFIDRLKSVANNKSKGVALVQINLIIVLKNKTFNWYHYELSNHTK